MDLHSNKKRHLLTALLVVLTLCCLAGRLRSATDAAPDDRNLQQHHAEASAVVETAALLLLQRDGETETIDDCLFESVFTMIAETDACDDNTVCIATSIINMLGALEMCAEKVEATWSPPPQEHQKHQRL